MALQPYVNAMTRSKELKELHAKWRHELKQILHASGIGGPGKADYVLEGGAAEVNIKNIMTHFKLVFFIPWELQENTDTNEYMALCVGMCTAMKEWEQRQDYKSDTHGVLKEWKALFNKQWTSQKGLWSALDRKAAMTMRYVNEALTYCKRHELNPFH